MYFLQLKKTPKTSPILSSSCKRRVQSQNGAKTVAPLPPARLWPLLTYGEKGGDIRGGGLMGSGRHAAPCLVGAGGRAEGLASPLCVETGGGNGRGADLGGLLEARRPHRPLLRLHSWPLEEQLGWAGPLAVWPGLGFEAEGGLAAWAGAVERRCGRGDERRRVGTALGASRRAAATLTLTAAALCKGTLARSGRPSRRHQERTQTGRKREAEARQETPQMASTLGAPVLFLKFCSHILGLTPLRRGEFNSLSFLHSF